MRLSLHTSLVLSALLVGCASTPSSMRPATPLPHRTRLAVVPARWTTVEPPFATDTAQVAVDVLTHIPSVDVKEARRIPSASTDAAGPACQEDPACLRRAGSALGAKKVVVIQLAWLGDTVLAQVALIDVTGGTQEQTRQQVVRSANREKVEGAVRQMVRDLAQPYLPPTPPTPPPSWYERWWVWTAVGAVVAGGITAAALVTSRAESSPPAETPPDAVITPP